MKPVYALVTVKNEDRETTIEGWVNTEERLNPDDELCLTIQPSLEYVEGGLTLGFLFKEVISMMPTQPITAYSSETIPIEDGNQILEQITPEENSLDTLW